MLNFRWLRLALGICFVSVVLGCGGIKPRVDAGSADKKGLHVLVDKGFRAEWVEGPGVVIIPDENCAMPRSCYFVFKPWERWKLDGLRGRLLSMGALRVEVD